MKTPEFHRGNFPGNGKIEVIPKIPVTRETLSLAYLPGVAEPSKAIASGAGAVGIAIAKTLHSVGVREILSVDRREIIHGGRGDLNPYKREVAKYNVHGVEKIRGRQWKGPTFLSE